LNTQNLISDLTKDLTPVKPMPSTLRRTALILILMSIGAGIVFFFFSRRHDLAEVVTQKQFIVGGVALLIGWISASYSLSLLQLPTLHNRKSFFWGLSAVCLLACFYLEKGVASPNFVDGFHGGLNCSIDILFLSLIPLALLFTVVRRSAPTKFIYTGINIALCCASLGALLLQFSCPSNDPAHLLLWHLILPLTSLVAVGALVATKILKW
jgi:hypothetical protein